MIHEERKNSKTKEESGIAENEKANYTGADSSKENNDQEKDHSSIKETDVEEKKDDTGGDLAGNASGSTDAD